MLTARLSLRRPTPDDIDAILRLHSDPVACAHNPADMFSTRDVAVERYRQWSAHWDEHGFGYWAVEDSLAERGLLGFCGLKVMTLHGRRVLNLFYRFDPAVWGDGIATEAATAVVAWAAAAGTGLPVAARVRPANVASARVAEHAGLHRMPDLDVTGEDGLDWIFTSADWTP